MHTAVFLPPVLPAHLAALSQGLDATSVCRSIILRGPLGSHYFTAVIYSLAEPSACDGTTDNPEAVTEPAPSGHKNTSCPVVALQSLVAECRLRPAACSFFLTEKAQCSVVIEEAPEGVTLRKKLRPVWGGVFPRPLHLPEMLSGILSEIQMHSDYIDRFQVKDSITNLFSYLMIMTIP